MLRITMVSQNDEEAVLKIEGWISRENVGLLEQEGNRLLQDSRHLVLDLTGVRSIDQVGISLLQHWAGKRLVVRDGSRFVRMLLEDKGLR